MLFNSPVFLFAFLPLAVAFFLLAGRWGVRAQIYLLTIASLFFYSFWKVEYLGILLSNIAVMFTLGQWMLRTSDRRLRLLQLLAGIAFCLGVLGYYKYTHFLMANLGFLVDLQPVQARTIPIGLSFYTFTSIAFLVDVYRREIDNISLGEYGATITYFPHLVAGPILYHHDIIPQLRGKPHRLSQKGLYLFLIFFSVGLFKKVLLADHIAMFSDPIFDAVAKGGVPDTGQAWRAAICYTLQLYFDFSGYSDMAVGIANLFNIRIPINFFSPYKSRNIADFWRRWHISLGYFLRKYIYFPLGGSRRGLPRTLVNMMVVMALCGLWHGAGWSFIIWGVAHGLALCVYKLWAAYGFRLREGAGTVLRVADRLAATLLTFLFTTLCWVVFRSDTIETAWTIIKAMFSSTGSKLRFIPTSRAELYMGLLLVVVWVLPNLYQWLDAYQPATPLYKTEQGLPAITSSRVQALAGLLCGVLFAVAFVAMLVNGQSSYLYFEF
ncbi:MBOAT family O-acyltransferase [Pseudodesulfovibrio sp.]|uniref:MBOAT family O-acyltransferase n=1 Tax=unclassified Pseudodesulfovibrio TaxID=2661612 RepID=UPI003B0007AB